MKSYELRNKYLEFFKEHGHTEIPSASLIPENDPTVLFTTAGMHPLVPYLLGEKHPGGTRLCNVQKCVRTGDIDEVGDNSHCTFFEMLGNWSLGDYFKEEAIAMSHEFLTSAKWLGIDKQKLYFTVFEGDEDAPRDDESAGYWMSHGVDASHIFYLPKKDNWWGPAGKEGPCGPDTEMFIDTGKPACGDDCHPGCSCGKFLEIWNDVFMQYYKNQPFNSNHLRPCPLLDNPERIIEIVELSGAKSTDFIKPEDVHDLSAKCTDAAEKWEQSADRLWYDSRSCMGCTSAAASIEKNSVSKRK